MTKAAVRAGAAAEAGEEQKDIHHENKVFAASGLFYPLVVETLGLWSLFSIKTLNVIASKPQQSEALNSIKLSKI